MQHVSRIRQVPVISTCKIRRWSVYACGLTLYSSCVGPLQIWGGIKSLSPIIFGMNHVLACVWWYIGAKMNHSDLRPESHWVQHYNGFGCPMDEFLRCSSIEERYLVSYYWVFASLTTNGLVGDMTPKNMVEIAFTCIVMLVSLTLYAYVLGEISNLVMKQDEDLVATRSSILQVMSLCATQQCPAVSRVADWRCSFARSANSQLFVQRFYQYLV